ncbi:MAG: hypothetical protein EZS28_017336 [Streblomastix strix]|uniref:Uncharacterized protein n=1 Tax=Streblomastix strix TaxID=222440 RepID=A0A5J4VXV4_9EUKA|nr:MAG: hypothetical protein EZS28_017336 [Streblomastix strix]
MHINQGLDQQRLAIRRWSRICLYYIQYYGDIQVQSELVNIGYGRVMSITLSTAGGIGEEQDEQISNGLSRISWFPYELHEGRTWQPSFQPLPLLVRNTQEQIEEEGANEEVEAQMTNKENKWNSNGQANSTKAVTLNRFIHRH